MANGYSIPTKLSGLSHCSVTGCSVDAYCRGFCRAHYYRLITHGDPEAGCTIAGHPRKFMFDTIKSSPVGCVIWPFSRTKLGYAMIAWNGKTSLTCRVVLQLTVGNAPRSGLHAAHKCGNGRGGCMNPACLYWATPKENYSDRVRLGTTSIGEANPCSKLKNEQVIAILGDGRIPRLIAEDYGVSRRSIADIKAGKTWQHIQRT